MITIIGTITFINCNDLRAAMERAFSSWEAHHPLIRFHDVTLQCNATYEQLITAGYEKGKDDLRPEHQLLRAELKSKSSGKVLTDDGDGRTSPTKFEDGLRG